MKLVLISDTHEQHRKIQVPDGDVLIHAGDFTHIGDPSAVKDFNAWLGKLPHRRKILIAGNHELTFERSPAEMQALITNACYLQDSGVEFGGLKFWGSPYTPEFFNWAFMYPRRTERWKEIPDDTDVLITHGPPAGLLDRPFGRMSSVGCQDLRNRVMDIKPRLNVFGHIHGDYGRRTYCGVEFVNASVVNEAYQPVNKPWEIEL